MENETHGLLEFPDYDCDIDMYCCRKCGESVEMLASIEEIKICLRCGTLYTLEDGLCGYMFHVTKVSRDKSNKITSGEFLWHPVSTSDTCDKCCNLRGGVKNEIR